MIIGDKIRPLDQCSSGLLGGFALKLALKLGSSHEQLEGDLLFPYFLL